MGQPNFVPILCRFQFFNIKFVLWLYGRERCETSIPNWGKGAKYPTINVINDN